MCVTALLAAGAGLGASKLLAAKPKTSPLVDPAAERAAAEASATQAANSKLAQKNRSRAVSSLLAAGGVNTAGSNVAALGAPPGTKTTLGQ